MIESEKTKNGLVTIKYDNKYIHSKYDPVREAQQFAEANIKLLHKPIILVYGLGLGYHIDAIAKKVNAETKVFVFEYNVELIECCKKINNKVFQYRNVKIIGSDRQWFYEKFGECLNEAEDIIIHRASLDTIRFTNERLYNLVNDYSILKQSGEYNEILIKLGKENFQANRKQNYENITEFINLYENSNKPYVITASGPSLDDELEILKENRERFNIISVGSSFKALMNKNIKPDAIVIIDGKEIVKKQFEGYETETIPLCFAATASRWAVDYYKGPKYMFNNQEDNVRIATRGTVAVAAMDISIKCGAKKIIFLGQDLAFIGERSHTKEFEKIYGFKDDYKQVYKNKTIKGIDGSNLDTTQGYITFKNKIENLIRKNIDVKFINCSKGAFIEGAEHIDFKTFILTMTVYQSQLKN